MPSNILKTASIILAYASIVWALPAHSAWWFSKKDSAPNVVLDSSKIKDAVPKQEPIKRAGNFSPYTVLGKTYHVMPSAKGYQGQGVASWYGKKFHGRLTSNGEVYDMYAMTAAHKTLPIPAYVRVENLDNGKSAIVRVNDRGPFHTGRIIDLSYAAATKLGVIATGTANVRVTIVDTSPKKPEPVVAKMPTIGALSTDASITSIEEGWVAKGQYLQVANFNSAMAAEKLQKKTQASVTFTTHIVETSIDGSLRYRVLVGPIAEASQRESLEAELLLLGFDKPFAVRY